MDNIAIVLCREAETNVPKKRGRIERLKGLFASMKKPQYDLEIKEVPFESFSIFSLYIPFTQFEITNLNKARMTILKQRINEKLKENSIVKCLGESSLCELLDIDQLQKNKANEGKLYKYLLLHLLKKIYDERGYSLAEIDISIIAGEDKADLFAVIRLLAQKVKYLTVITKERQDLEADTDQFCNETGLAISVTSDFVAGVKDADLIINLGDVGSYTLNSRAESKALILNFGEWGDVLLSTNKMVNGIRVALPRKIASLLEPRMFQYISELEIAQRDVMGKAGWDYETMDLQFRCKGYIVKSLLGRRNRLKMEEVWGTQQAKK